MNFKNSILTVVLAVTTISVIGTGCKKKFDEPPYDATPSITVTTTIAALKAMHTVGGAYDNITADITIRGVVIANDRSGNLYKEIYIQDATGAIAVELEATSLYGNYPVGKEIFIKCKGLTLSDYGGMIQIGMLERSVPSNPTLAGIPSTLIENYVVRGKSDNAVPVTTVTSIAGLSTSMQNAQLGTLISLSGFEFGTGDLGKTWADTSAFKKSVNLNIKDCGGANTIIVRTSGYANFAGVKIPQGNGTIVGLYTVFGSTKQLLIRDTADVKFTGGRCFLFEEDFQSYTSTGTAALNITGWKNIMETGDVPYTMATFSGNVFPKVSAFTSAAMPTTNISTWLISPDIQLPSGTTPKYTFTCSRRYPAGTFKAYVSTNFTGSNLATATWTLLATVPAGSSTGFTPFDVFGPYDFTAYAGQKINVAFRYEAPSGTSAGSVGTYEPDDVKITKN